MKATSILSRLFVLLFALFIMFGTTGCSKVPAGNVGVKFYLLGGDKGVDHEVLTPGRYWIGMNEELYLFPTFTQNYTWCKSKEEGNPTDESFNFQDIQGLELNADIGITYHLEASKVPNIFQKYKRGIDEITDVFLRNMVRDALVSRTSKLSVETIYGEGRSALMDSVTYDVKRQVEPIGITIEKIYWIGRIKIPDAVKDQIEQKIAATQKALQRENELREAEAEGKKRIALAEAERIELQNKALALTPNLLQYEALKKWDGKLPNFISGNAPIPFIKF